MGEIKMVVNASFSSRDCYSFGWCPHCGASINSWTSIDECAFCHKPIAWTLKKMQERKFHRDEPKETTTKVNEPVSAITADDIPAINAVIAKGDRVEIGPGPNGTVKITHVKRQFIKNGR